MHRIHHEGTGNCRTAELRNCRIAWQDESVPQRHRATRTPSQVSWLLFLLVFSLGLLCPPAWGRNVPEESVIVYGIFAGETTCPAIEQRLAALPLRETAIISVEESGGRFVLDDPTGEQQLRCAVDALARGGHRVKFMILQDTMYLGNDTEAIRRVRAAAQFAKKNHGVESAVVDIEPHAARRWTEGSSVDRSAIALQFTRMLKQLKKQARPLRLEAAVPWWLMSTRDVPEIARKPLLASVDGVYLMFYEMSGEANKSVAQHVQDRLWLRDPILKRGRVYLMLNTEDEPSQEQLDRDIAALAALYGRTKGFAGISVFHAGGTFSTGKAGGGR